VGIVGIVGKVLTTCIILPILHILTLLYTIFYNMVYHTKHTIPCLYSCLYICIGIRIDICIGICIGICPRDHSPSHAFHLLFSGTGVRLHSRGYFQVPYTRVFVVAHFGGLLLMGDEPREQQGEYEIYYS